MGSPGAPLNRPFLPRSAEAMLQRTVGVWLAAAETLYSSIRAAPRGRGARPRTMPESEAKTRRRKWLVPVLLVGGLVAVAGGYVLHLRYVRKNFDTVVDGQVYRSAQPGAADLREWRDEHGIRTVLNLRGNEEREPVREEIAAAGELGLNYVCIRLPNREHPDPEDIAGVIEVLRTAERPILFHCRSGADRSGVIGVVAAMLVGGESYEQASEELSWRHMHIDRDPEHVAGFMMLYEDYCREKGLDTAGWEQFEHWFETVYSPPRRAKPTTRPTTRP